MQWFELIALVVVAALTIAAAGVLPPRGWLVWAIPALGAFGLSIGREPSVVFLVVFVSATVILGVAALRGQMPSSRFALFAASDLFLALAVTAQQRATVSWALPAAGGWAPRAAVLLGVASILRLGSIRTDDRPEAALVGWWQGVALAWLAGTSAPLVLAVGGLALWATCAWGNRGRGPSYLAVAGGMIALVSAAGGTTTAIVVAALAGVAGFMGERTISTFALAFAPLSVATGLAVPFGGLTVAAAAALLAAMLGAGQQLTQPLGPPSHWSGRLVAAGSAIGGVFLLNQSSIVWLMFATGAAATLIHFLTRPNPLIVLAPSPSSVPDPRHRRVMIGAWAIVAMALIMGVRLTVYGLGTGFL